MYLGFKLGIIMASTVFLFVENIFAIFCYFIDVDTERFFVCRDIVRDITSFSNIRVHGTAHFRTDDILIGTFLINHLIIDAAHKGYLVTTCLQTAFDIITKHNRLQGIDTDFSQFRNDLVDITTGVMDVEHAVIVDTFYVIFLRLVFMNSRQISGEKNRFLFVPHVVMHMNNIRFQIFVSKVNTF